MSATNRGSRRLTRDQYQTPIYAVQALLRAPWTEKFRAGNWTFLEPGAGDGHILLPFRRRTVGRVYWYEIAKGRDYLRSRPRNVIDLCVTNVPYSLSIEFLTKMLADCHTVVALLPLNFFGSKKRAEFFRAHPCTHLFPLSERPVFVAVCDNPSCKALYRVDEPRNTCQRVLYSRWNAKAKRMIPKRCKGTLLRNRSDASEYAWFVWDAGKFFPPIDGRWLTVL